MTPGTQRARDPRLAAPRGAAASRRRRRRLCGPDRAGDPRLAGDRRGQRLSRTHRAGARGQGSRAHGGKIVRAARRCETGRARGLAPPHCLVTRRAARWPPGPTSCSPRFSTPRRRPGCDIHAVLDAALADPDRAPRDPSAPAARAGIYRLAQLTVVLAAARRRTLALLALAAPLSGAHWQQAPLELARHLPHAFALGEAVSVRVTLENPGRARRRGRYFELADPSMLMPDMPLRFAVGAGGRTLEFELKPTARGLKSFGAGQIFLRSSLGLLDWNLRIGASESRRVFPDFKRQAALAGLATDGGSPRSESSPCAAAARARLRPAGRIPRRRAGPPRRLESHAQVRPPDHAVFPGQLRPVRDVPARLRAADVRRRHPIGHRRRPFRPIARGADAARLRRALARRCGGRAHLRDRGGAEKRFAPRKGRQTLNALMAELGDVEPSPMFSDYTAPPPTSCSVGASAASSW